MRFKRNKHSLSHFVNCTTKLGKLTPVSCVEVLPGDSIRHQSSVLLRMKPMVAPVMHPMDVRLHHFYVPMRLLWSSWEDFITGGSDGNNTDTVPTISTTAAAGTIPNYLGIAPLASPASVNALPIRAYNMIFNEYYRDQDLVTEALEDQTVMHEIAWEKDRFTAARPWTQKGTEVSLPLGTDAPISMIVGPAVTGHWQDQNGQTYPTSGTAAVNSNQGTTEISSTSVQYDPGGSLKVDLSNATAATINDLRLAFATQSYKELRARYGSNYVDYLGYLGITGVDNRIQRPEYLGGGKQTVSISEVLQTAPEAASSSEVGEMKGHGIAGLRANRYTRFIPEHGYIMTMLSVRPKAIYSSGIPKKFLRQDKEDFYQRELELIGQEEVYNKEVYGDHSSPDGVFGYVDRYSDYREEDSRVAGGFTVGQSNDHWTLARSFSSDPALNSTFVTCTPTERTFAATGHNVLAMVNHSIQARRLVRRNAQPKTF